MPLRARSPLCKLTPVHAHPVHAPACAHSPLHTLTPVHTHTPPCTAHTSTFEGVPSPLAQGRGLSRTATAATSQEEEEDDSELGMKARGGWHRAGAPSQAPRRWQWARLGTRLLHTPAPGRPQHPLAGPCSRAAPRGARPFPPCGVGGCRRAGVARAEQCRGRAAPLQLEQTSLQTSLPARCHRLEAIAAGVRHGQLASLLCKLLGMQIWVHLGKNVLTILLLIKVAEPFLLVQ